MPWNYVQSGDFVDPSTTKPYPGAGRQMFVEPSWNAARVAIRPLDYMHLGQVLGHYRAVSFSGAVNTISAAGVLASLRWVDPNVKRFLVLLRLSTVIEVTGAITAATPLDVAAYTFRASTAMSSGTGSSTLSGSVSNSQKKRQTMGASLLLANGEVRTIGTTTALSASAGKTNDGAPFGAAFFGTQIAPNVGATANLTAPIAALVTGWQDLLAVQGPYDHPIVLADNEGIELQAITATATTGSIKYAFLWDWAEVAIF